MEGEWGLPGLQTDMQMAQSVPTRRQYSMQAVVTLPLLDPLWTVFPLRDAPARAGCGAFGVLLAVLLHAEVERVRGIEQKKVRGGKRVWGMKRGRRMEV
jgi:hypothetical protein